MNPPADKHRSIGNKGQRAERGRGLRPNGKSWCNPWDVVKICKRAEDRVRCASRCASGVKATTDGLLPHRGEVVLEVDVHLSDDVLPTGIRQSGLEAATGRAPRLRLPSRPVPVGASVEDGPRKRRLDRRDDAPHLLAVGEIGHSVEMRHRAISARGLGVREDPRRAPLVPGLSATFKSRRDQVGARTTSSESSGSRMSASFHQRRDAEICWVTDGWLTQGIGVAAM